MRRGKRYHELSKLIEKDKVYSVEEAAKLVKKSANAKFDETIELCLRLGIDPKRQDQIVRGTVLLPHGTGKSKVVAVVAKGEKAKEAEKAGADIVGGEDLIEKIAKEGIKFDALITTPDCMRDVSKLGKILGPKGLMPSPKTGTVTFEIADAIKKIKAGQVEFRIDGYGIIHLSVGKASFDEGKLADNINTVLREVQRVRPPSVKGQYLRSISVSSTMGPGIKVSLPRI
jgi:large subunit ribosomal protein L1